MHHKRGTFYLKDTPLSLLLILFHKAVKFKKPVKSVYCYDLFFSAFTPTIILQARLPYKSKQPTINIIHADNGIIILLYSSSSEVSIDSLLLIKDIMNPTIIVTITTPQPPIIR
jgi:hypothetical protein